MSESAAAPSRLAKFLEPFGTWTSGIARAIGIEGFLVLAYSAATPAVREWLADVTTQSATFSAALDQATAPPERMTTAQLGASNSNRRRSQQGKAYGGDTGRVDFDPPFESASAVSVGISALDANTDLTVRVRVEVADVTDVNGHRFTYRVDTWRSSINYGVEVNWIAGIAAGTLADWRAADMPVSQRRGESTIQQVHTAIAERGLFGSRCVHSPAIASFGQPEQPRSGY